jgi:Zn-dependent protease with chaperone function
MPYNDTIELSTKVKNAADHSGGYMDSHPPPEFQGNIASIRRWGSEPFLFATVLALSIALWVLFAVSVVGLVYALLFAVFLFVSHIVFIAHLRGSAVRIGPEQFPDLHHRIAELAFRVGLKNPPDAYLMQAGGSLNAFAAKLFRSNFIVLYSDLLEACGNNTGARDMIIGHELGHIRAGHLRFSWLLLPGMFFPLIGSAYSQAREYTCDRYGAAACGGGQDMLLGLAILSAGAKYGPLINVKAFADQRGDLNTGFITIGKWLSTHPPLSERMVALHSALALDGRKPHWKGRIRAIAIILSVIVVFCLGTFVLGKRISEAIKNAQKSTQSVPKHQDSGKPSALPDNRPPLGPRRAN